MQDSALELDAVTVGATTSTLTDVGRLGSNDGTVDGCINATPRIVGATGSASSAYSATAHDEKFYVTTYVQSYSMDELKRANHALTNFVAYQTTCLRPSGD